MLKLVSDAVQLILHSYNRLIVFNNNAYKNIKIRIDVNYEM